MASAAGRLALTPVLVTMVLGLSAHATTLEGPLLLRPDVRAAFAGPARADRRRGFPVG